MLHAALINQTIICLEVLSAAQASGPAQRGPTAPPVNRPVSTQTLGSRAAPHLSGQPCYLRPWRQPQGSTCGIWELVLRSLYPLGFGPHSALRVPCPKTSPQTPEDSHLLGPAGQGLPVAESLQGEVWTGGAAWHLVSGPAHPRGLRKVPAVGHMGSPHWGPRFSPRPYMLPRARQRTCRAQPSAAWVRSCRARLFCYQKYGGNELPQALPPFRATQPQSWKRRPAEERTSQTNFRCYRLTQHPAEV